MSKSFKKVIACLLAVLMVTFSVPFSGPSRVISISVIDSKAGGYP